MCSRLNVAAFHLAVHDLCTEGELVVAGSPIIEYSAAFPISWTCNLGNGDAPILVLFIFLGFAHIVLFSMLPIQPFSIYG